MIRVSVLYPKTDGAKFDMDYYLKKHMPMVKRKLGAAMKGATVEKGVSGGAPGTPAAYGVIAHLTFDSVDAFNKAMAPAANEIMGDIPNYTTIAPVMQISEIVM
jgi:uncharacterized protein (TIGR02118 family)